MLASPTGPPRYTTFVLCFGQKQTLRSNLGFEKTQVAPLASCVFAVSLLGCLEGSLSSPREVPTGPFHLPQASLRIRSPCGTAHALPSEAARRVSVASWIFA
jgi:hypothetical protein